MKMLLAVDGSSYSIKAARYLAMHVGQFRDMPEIHLFHVKLPIPSGLALAQADRVLGHDAIDRYYREEAEAALTPAGKILREENIPFRTTFRVGDIAHEIQTYADKNGIDLIVMGSHGHGAAKNLLMGSVATKVLAATSQPVLIVR